MLQLALMDEQNQGDRPADNPPLANQQPDTKPTWQYQSGNLSPSIGYDDADAQNTELGSGQAKSAADHNAVSWSASEFVSNEKTSSWYVLLVAATVVLAGLIYLITREIFSVVVVILVAFALGYFAKLKPRVLDYTVASDGIQVGNRHFMFDEFKSFAVMNDGPIPSIQLLPHKRFMIPLTLYFEPTDGDRIINVLGEYLPFEHRERDVVDKVISKIRF